jgi:hypothetical protein
MTPYSRLFEGEARSNLVVLKSSAIPEPFLNKIENAESAQRIDIKG